MQSLVESLKRNPKFHEFSREKQEILLRLADEFEDNDFALYLSPSELADKLQIGNKFQWQEFLSIPIVKQYIKNRVAENLEVLSRKQIKSLENEAMRGNVQAARHINELSGVLNAGERNRIVILHQISRPKEVIVDGNGNVSDASTSTTTGAGIH